MSADLAKHQYNAVKEDNRQNLIEQFLAGIKLEQDSYFMSHPEIIIMLKRYIAKNAAHRHKPKNVLKDAALYFTRPTETLQKEINEILNLSIANHPYLPKVIENLLRCEPLVSLESLLDESNEDEITIAQNSECKTTTSSFITVLTSRSTLATPEPMVITDGTISDMLREEILKLVDKAVCSPETDEYILYDIVYTEIMKVVEFAMEMPVIEIQKDLAILLELAYIKFEHQIKEKARTDLEKTRKDGVKKKKQKLLRHCINYKGYGGPSEVFETSLQKASALEGHQNLAHFRFNRYPKDEFGVYLPEHSKFSEESVTFPIQVEEIFKESDRKLEIETIHSLDSKSGILLTTTPSTYNTYNTKSCTNKKMFYINKRNRQLSIDINQTTKMLLYKINPILFR